MVSNSFQYLNCYKVNNNNCYIERASLKKYETYIIKIIT